MRCEKYSRFPLALSTTKALLAMIYMLTHFCNASAVEQLLVLNHQKIVKTPVRLELMLSNAQAHNV